LINLNRRTRRALRQQRSPRRQRPGPCLADSTQPSRQRPQERGSWSPAPANRRDRTSCSAWPFAIMLYELRAAPNTSAGLRGHPSPWSMTQRERGGSAGRFRAPTLCCRSMVTSRTKL